MTGQRTQRPPATTATLGSIGEREWLRRVRRWVEGQPADLRERLVIGVGDDAAVLRGEAGPLVVTTDALIEGVHFRREWMGARDLGWKAMVANLSDLAAMAAEPMAAFLCLSLPGAAEAREVERFFRGVLAAGEKWGCPLAGGDLTRAPQWSIALTLLGRPPRKGRVARRDAARPGQNVYVTGNPGESGAGLEALRRGLESPLASRMIKRHRRPEPRLTEGMAVAGYCRDLAMLDVSDGVWNDAGQLAEASGVGIELELGRLPVSRQMGRLARELGIDPLQWVLFGGEDYELLFTTRGGSDQLVASLNQAGLKTPIHRIGRVTKGRGVRLVDPAGRLVPVQDRTFQHF